MSQLKKLERDKKTNFDRFNQKFLESDSLIEQEQEAAKKMMKIKKNIDFEDDDNMIDDLGINMKNLFFKILEMLADKENPIPYIMDNSKRQFTFAVMIISIGGLLMFFSNLMISN
jgi:hypothetical protein